MIHAFPGMGADSRMYPSPWDGLKGWAAHDWPKHRGERTLGDIARTVSEQYVIQDGDSLIGSSLGGMVAGEITKLRRIDTLYLLGSAIHPSEVNSLLNLLHPLADFAPIDWLRVSAAKMPVELAQMFAGVDASFVRAMCAAVFQWEGIASHSVRIIRIHGRNDLVIPPPRVVDLLLNAGHLISISHAKECMEFIAADRCARAMTTGIK